MILKVKIKIEMLESTIIIALPKNMEEFNSYRRKKYKDYEDYTDADGVVVKGAIGDNVLYSIFVPNLLYLTKGLP